MRPLEIVLTFANLVALGLLVIPRLRPPRLMPYIILLPALVAVMQAAAEGPRWQMIPAYALAILALLLWLPKTLIRGGIRVGQAGHMVTAMLGILMLAVSIALPVVLPVFRFPRPTGPYAIGTLTYRWTDSSRRELFVPAHDAPRVIVAQVWYPARLELGAPRAPYIADADRVTPLIAALLHAPRFIFTHLKYVTTNAVQSAPVANEEHTYPVLIYLTGVDGFRSVSTFQVQELVSHGYIVVGLDQPGIAPLVDLPGGRQVLGLPHDEIQPLIMQSVAPQSPAPSVYGQPHAEGVIPYFAQDASFVLDQLARVDKDDPQHILTGRLDLDHAGVFGVSLGGMDAAEACLRDARLRACLIMDVWMPSDVVKAGLRQPAMFITRDAGTLSLEHQANGTFSPHDAALTLDTMRATYDKLPTDGYFVAIRGMFHVNFTDLPYWSPLMHQLGQTGPIDAQHGFDIVNVYTIAFFDKELKGIPSPLLTGPSAQYPEVHLESRR